MSIAQQLGARQEAFEQRLKANNFVSLQRSMLAARGDVQVALQMAPQIGASAGATALLKSAVAAGSTTTWSQLNDYREAVGGFLASLRGFGIFDTLLPSMLQLPLHTRIAVTISAITASKVGEMAAKPISRLSLANATLEPIKVVGEAVLSAELVRGAGPVGNALVADQLRLAVAKTTDAAFLELLLTGISSTPSSGGDVRAIRGDLSTALDALVTGADSKIYFIVSSSVAKRLSIVGDSNGGSAFPGMSPSGGTIGNVSTLVSDDLPAGTLVALDASQIAAGAGELEARTAQHATIALDAAPDSPPVTTTNVTSLWQHDLIATRLERFFGAQRLHDTAVSAISGINYTGNSPA